MLLVPLSACNFKDTALDNTPDSGTITAPEDMTPQSPSMGDMTSPGLVEGDMTSSCAQDDEELCRTRNIQCGIAEVVDSCQQARQLDCGTCPSPSTCDEATNLCSCVPQSDEELCNTLEYDCGAITLFDNCGELREIQCGSCGEGIACENNRCDGCVSESSDDFCTRLGATCGTVSAADNCGIEREVVCGQCDPSTEVCSPMTQTCECVPETDPQLCGKNNKDCGTFTTTDRCGEMKSVDCGPCSSGECQENQCTVCTPESDESFCARQNVVCGAAQGMDNCGTSRTVSDCGPCGTAEICDASGQCECPTPRCEPGACGTVSNACGATRDCGSCSILGQVCSNNTCSCPPVACGANSCGTVSNTCGSNIDCGGCNSDEACINNACVCQPESDEDLCRFRMCGNINVIDRCGVARTVSCGGSCPTGQLCTIDGFCCPKFDPCLQP